MYPIFKTTTKQQTNKAPWVTIVTRSPEVSALTVLCQDIRARSLEVQHASIEGAIMRVSEGNTGGWTRKAVRTTQTRDNGWHLVLGGNTHTNTQIQPL